MTPKRPMKSLNARLVPKYPLVLSKSANHRTAIFWENDILWIENKTSYVPSGYSRRKWEIERTALNRNEWLLLRDILNGLGGKVE